MLKACKNVSWIILLTLVVDAVGVLFGILAANELGKMIDPTGNGGDFAKYALMGASIIIAIVVAISTIVAFVSMRGGEVKSAILALGKHTKIQLLAPMTCLVLGIVGIVKQATDSGSAPEYPLLMLLIVSYVIVLFVSGFNSRGLKAYRKDKESYGYISITSFIICAGLIFFCVIATIAMTKIPSSADNNLVGYLEVFAVLFTVGDVVAFFCLGVIAQIVKKYAPKVTVADADAAQLNEMNENIKAIARAQNIQPQQPAPAAQQNTPAPQAQDNVSELRRYKQLYDDGIITKEEFEAKKKQLLG